MTDIKKGSLKIVGTGIHVINQTTISARNYIETADVVYSAVSSPAAIHWITSLNANVVSLNDFYTEGRCRVDIYRDIIEAMANAVREGNNVVAVFYGHPGVFVTPTHKVMKILREEGYQVSMDPGVSAEDCLIADLGIDPGSTGCQAMESTQFLFYRHQINPHHLLILWQISLSGEHTLKFMPQGHSVKGLEILAESLLQYYPPDHEVILYEAATMPVSAPRIEPMALKDLPLCKPTLISTLVVPSIGLPEFDEETLAKFGISIDDVMAPAKEPSAEK